MTRTSFILAILIFVLSIVAAVGGLAASSPAALVVPLLCGSPLFMLFLGLGIGRASNEYKIVRQERTPRIVQPGQPPAPRKAVPLA